MIIKNSKYNFRNLYKKIQNFPQYKKEIKNLKVLGIMHKIRINLMINYICQKYSIKN